MTSIWTLDSRDNQFVPLVEDFLELSTAQVRGLILEMHADLMTMLQGAGLNYASLRNSLVPQSHKSERAFVFKTTLIDEPWYGGRIAQQLVPALAPDLHCSILTGDLIWDDQLTAHTALNDVGVFHESFDDINTAMLYIVYINNLTENRAQALHEKLQPTHRISDTSQLSIRR